MQKAADHYLEAVNLIRADYNIVVDTRKEAGIKPLTYVDWLESQLVIQQSAVTHYRQMYEQCLKTINKIQDIMTSSFDETESLLKSDVFDTSDLLAMLRRNLIAFDDGIAHVGSE